MFDGHCEMAKVRSASFALLPKNMWRVVNLWAQVVVEARDFDKVLGPAGD